MAGWDDVVEEAWDPNSGPRPDSSVAREPDPSPVPASDGDLASDLFGDEDEEGGAGQQADIDAASSSTPTAGPAIPVSPAPTGGKLTIADRVARAEAAAASDEVELTAAGHRQAESRRHDRLDLLWQMTDRVLGYVSAEHDLQMALNDLAITRDPAVDREQRRRLEELIRPRLVHANVALEDSSDIHHIFDLVYDEWTGISVLGPIWRDDEITEIMVDAWDRVVVERDGQLHLTDIQFRDREHALSVARNLSQKVSDRAVNESNPIATAELPGARLHFNVGKIVRSGLSVTIRKFRPLMGVEKLLEVGAFDQEIVDFLNDAVGRGRANVLVSGGTGTGKTTMLNAVSSFIPDTERVVTIEDAFELDLQNEMWVPMQTKEASSADSTSSVFMGDLLKSSLRMRPDRIVVGEIRGAEARVMIQAASTGHDGTMSTIHANDPESALSNRLPDMLLEAREMPEKVVRRQIATAVDIVVQISRRAGRRFVSEIAEVDLCDLTDSGVVPHVLFVGELGPDGNPVHRRVGALRPGTELALKMADYGADVDRWSTKPKDA